MTKKKDKSLPFGGKDAKEKKPLMSLDRAMEVMRERFGTDREAAPPYMPLRKDHSDGDTHWFLLRSNEKRDAWRWDFRVYRSRSGRVLFSAGEKFETVEVHSPGNLVDMALGAYMDIMQNGGDDGADNWAACRQVERIALEVFEEEEERPDGRLH